MNRIVRNYVVGDMHLNVEAECPSWIAGLDASIGRFATDVAPGNERERDKDKEKVFRLLARRAGPLEHGYSSADLRLLWRGTVGGCLEAIHHVGDGIRRIELPGKAQLWIDLKRRQADLRVGRCPTWQLHFGCIAPMLWEFLAQTGQYVLHAACLAADTRPDAAGLLIAGDSGSGKTTTALALARAGLRLETDDATLMVPQDGKVTVWGLPRPCKVHTETFRLLRWLQPLRGRRAATDHEYLIDIDKITSPRPGRKLVPRVILLLAPRNRNGHEFSEVDATTALVELARQNLRVRDARAEGPSGRMFAALAGCVRQCRIYRLSAGAELESLADRVRALPGWKS